MKCTITTEGFGDMVFELYPDLAPITVKNFVDTARSGFYDGLAWCHIANPIPYKRGAISMVQDDGYDTAGTQFFVVHQDAHKLDGHYAAFGEMISGFEVLDQIAALPTSGPETWNKPDVMPVMSSVRIEE